MTDLSLAEAVLAWYRTNARDLPWRRPDVSPWGVLVSEVMLQQTQVSRVEPAWREWLARWPTPAGLAEATPAEAIRRWGRLGYPRRALRLHACAVAIVARHDGMVPDSVDDLLALPGVGEYTARAVATFGYRRRHPVVDTNVRRVLARAVVGVADAGPATSAADLRTAEALLPADPETAAAVSVAFMELGALVCTARAPRCPDCPLAGACRRLRGEADAVAPVPVPRRRPAQRYAGTDRQVRGLLLAVVREATGPVPAYRLDAVWTDDAQRTRALRALVADGLVSERVPGWYALPGSG